MTLPRIPGYTEEGPDNSLEALWQRPPGDYPDSFWPSPLLREILPTPVDWLTIEQHTRDGEQSIGRRCVLGPANTSVEDLRGTGWIGRDLGEAGIVNGVLDPGLISQHDSVPFEFFAQVRTPAGAPTPLLDLALPFLWCWDAFPTAAGWSYLDEGGWERPLVRVEIENGSWRIEVRSSEFRSYLQMADRVAVMQVDSSRTAPPDSFARVDDYFENDWATFHFWATSDGIMPNRSISGVIGQYFVRGATGRVVPRAFGYERAPNYPLFIYATNPEDGSAVHHSCDPDTLGNYFQDHGDGRPHYLTTVNFNRSVLGRYTEATSRFRVTRTRLECLNLWGLSIGINTVGLVEAYLGDLGRDLPASEWAHWLAHNVLPEGKVEEGRFRRDFLNQWADSEDPPSDLRAARMQANEASARALGKPLFRDLDEQTAVEFDALFGPLTDELSTLTQPIILLTKVFVDGLNSDLLARFKQDGEQAGTIALLGRLLDQLGEGEDAVSVLKDLQSVRSRGGVAHLPGHSDAPRARAKLGIEGLGAYEAFMVICRKLVDNIRSITRAIETGEPNL